MRALVLVAAGVIVDQRERHAQGQARDAALRLSERASVTARVRQAGSAKVVKDAFAFARRGAGKLTLDLRRLRAGRYRVSVFAADDTGNRSRTATLALRLR